MENQWAKASQASDGDAIGAMLADDFVSLDSDGTLHPKAEVVARTKKGHVEVDGSGTILGAGS
jgi:ketosteroid isomerase-like protein